MANTPTKLVIDCSTGERKEIPLSAEEIAECEAMAAQAEAEEQARLEAQAQREADRVSAIAKLTALGLTEDEATVLVGA
jgi:regulator of protease activity HflC (stomatin/prohibitin superfamily)